MRFKKNPSLPSLGKQKILRRQKHKKTKQNKTAAVLVNHFVLGNYSGDKKNKTMGIVYKEFFFGKITQKLPDFEGKQKLKVVRF